MANFGFVHGGRQSAYQGAFIAQHAWQQKKTEPNDNHVEKIQRIEKIKSKLSPKHPPMDRLPKLGANHHVSRDSQYQPNKRAREHKVDRVVRSEVFLSEAFSKNEQISKKKTTRLVPNHFRHTPKRDRQAGFDEKNRKRGVKPC